MKNTTWLLIVQKTRKEIARFYGTFEEAKSYFLTLHPDKKHNDDFLDIVSLSQKSGF